MKYKISEHGEIDIDQNKCVFRDNNENIFSVSQWNMLRNLCENTNTTLAYSSLAETMGGDQGALEVDIEAPKEQIRKVKNRLKEIFTKINDLGETPFFTLEEDRVHIYILEIDEGYSENINKRYEDHLKRDIYFDNINAESIKALRNLNNTNFEQLERNLLEYYEELNQKEEIIISVLRERYRRKNKDLQLSNYVEQWKQIYMRKEEILSSLEILEKFKEDIEHKDKVNEDNRTRR